MLKRIARYLSERFASVTVVPVGQENDGVDRRISGGGRGGGQNYSGWARDDRAVLKAVRENPQARRMIGVTTAHVLGAGLSVSSSNPEAARFAAAFWKHPMNRMDMRVDELCDELGRGGNLFVSLHRNRVDGMSYVRLHESLGITDIRCDVDDFESELEYTERLRGRMLGVKQWLSPEGAARAGKDPDAVMVHYFVNRPVGASWGESDLKTVIKWMRRYSSFLEDRVRLNAGTRLFLWMVKTRGDVKATIEKYRDPPEPGQVIVSDKADGEEWSVVAPNLQARDASADALLLRRQAVAGGLGTSLLDMGEGDDSNRASAMVGAQVKRRFLLRRQGYFCWLLSDLIATAYNRQPGVAPITADEIVINRPDIDVTDNEALAGAARDVARSIESLVGLYGRSPALLRYGLRVFQRFIQERLSEEEMVEILKGGEDDSSG